MSCKAKYFYSNNYKKSQYFIFPSEPGCPAVAFLEFEGLKKLFLKWTLLSESLVCCRTEKVHGSPFVFSEQFSSHCLRPFVLNKFPVADPQVVPVLALASGTLTDPGRSQPRQEKAVWDELINAFLFEQTCILHVGASPQPAN